MAFTTVLKAFVFHPTTDAVVDATTAKYSSLQLQAKAASFSIPVTHAASTPTNAEMKTAFETYFGQTDLAYKSFVVGKYGVLKAGNPTSLTDAADATFFCMTVHSDGTTVSYNVPVARFLSYGLNEIDTDLFWSIYPTNTTHYANMTKKTGVENQKVLWNGSTTVNSSEYVITTKGAVANGEVTPTTLN